MKKIIRFGSYPIVFGVSAVVVILAINHAATAWPWFAMITALSLGCIARLERVQPYQEQWLQNHGDLSADILYAVSSLGLLSLTAWALNFMRLDLVSLWPDTLSVWLQIFLAGVVIDAGLYFMHRLSHRIDWLWRLHAVHHSAERLYWLNGERRHPLSAVLLASPGIIVVVALGAPPLIISAWFTLLTVHLAFQHANLDYSVGPFRHFIGVAEIHRWHHKREYEDAQVNFGEYWMLWDQLFGSFHDQKNGVVAGDVGLKASDFPSGFLKQLGWPFGRQKKVRDCNQYEPHGTLMLMSRNNDYLNKARILAVYRKEMLIAVEARNNGDLNLAFHHYERAHILSQKYTWPHIKNHIGMLQIGVLKKDIREIFGQSIRIVAALIFSKLWVPTGNTGGANVSGLRPMPIPEDLQQVLEPR